MADNYSRGGTRAGADQGARNLLALIALTVVAAVAGVILWLALGAGETMERLQAEADRRSLVAELELPPAPAPRPEAAEPATPEPQPADVADLAEAEPDPAGVAEAPEPDEEIPPPPPPPAGPEQHVPDAPPAPEPEAVPVPETMPAPPAAEPSDEAMTAKTSDEEAAAPVPAPEPAEEAMPADEAASGEAAPSPGPAAESAPAPVEPLEDALPPVGRPGAPDPALAESSASGPLPRIAPDGRRPWQEYARPFPSADDRPRIAIVVTDLGQSGAATEAAIQGLPGAVSLAFAAHARNLDVWLPQARAAGHETLLMVPMEPVGYPRNDPGPHTLLTSLDAPVNRERLEWALGRARGYVGVVNAMGSRFTTVPEALRPVLETLNQRGLMFLDSRTAAASLGSRIAEEIGLPSAANDRFIDDIASRDAIDMRLRELEQLALERGYAVGLAYPYPVSFERIAAWIPTLEAKGIALAPITAIAALRQGQS